MKYIGPDLVTETGDFIFTFNIGEFLFLFLFFDFPEFGFEDLEGLTTILLLIPLGTTLDNDTGWLVNKPHCGVNFVDILSTRAPCARKGPLQIILFDINVDFFFNDRSDFDIGKRSLTEFVSIEWALADETVSTDLVFEISISIGGGDGDGGRFESGFLTGRFID